MYLFRLQQNTLFLSSLFLKKTTFYLCPFLLSLFLNWFMFHVFCLFLCLEKLVSHFVSLSFFILLFNSVSLLYSISYASQNKKCCFLGKTLEKISFLFLISWFKKHFVCEKVRFVFPLFLKVFSRPFKTKKIRQKSFIFCVCSVPFCFTEKME